MRKAGIRLIPMRWMKRWMAMLEKKLPFDARTIRMLREEIELPVAPDQGRLSARSSASRSAERPGTTRPRQGWTRSTPGG